MSESRLLTKPAREPPFAPSDQQRTTTAASYDPLSPAAASGSGWASTSGRFPAPKPSKQKNTSTVLTDATKLRLEVCVCGGGVSNDADWRGGGSKQANTGLLFLSDISPQGSHQCDSYPKIHNAAVSTSPAEPNLAGGGGLRAHLFSLPLSFVSPSSWSRYELSG